MDTIHSLSEIDYANNQNISFLATVISVVNDGDGDKRPFKAILKLEDSGEQTAIYSWKFDLLEKIKHLADTDDVYNFVGQANLYKDVEKQIRIGGATDAAMKSTKKIIKTVDNENLKKEMQAIVQQYIPKNSEYRVLLDELVFKNDTFWIWPAATKIHHAYPGGLAKHSLNVCKNAISIWRTYQGSNLNIATIVAGSLLHDIGKLSEYKSDGTRTIYGNLIPHIVDGYQKVVSCSIKNGMDPEKNTQLVMLGHIILSHHESLEFGSPVQPGILEATIVAKADALDAAVETSDDILDNLSLNEQSERNAGLNGSRIFKWHN